MAKFCRYCGNQLPDGGVCNCQGNASNVANNANQATVNQASVNQSNLGNGSNYNNQTNYNNQGNLNNGANYNNQGSYNNQANYSNQNAYANTAGVNRHFNYQSRGVINNFTSYFKDMKSTVVKAVNEKNTGFVFSSAAFLTISIIVNFLIMFNKFANDINSFINRKFGLFSDNYWYDSEDIFRLTFKTDNFEIILYGFLFTISVIAILLALVFILSRINKSNWSNEGIFYATIINTIPLSCVFLVGGILKLVFSYKFLVLIHIFYLVTYVITTILTYNMVTEGFKNVVSVIIYTIVMFIGIMIVSYVYTTIFTKVIGTFEVNGQTINYYISEFKKMMAEEIGYRNGNFFEYMLEEFLDDIF